MTFYSKEFDEIELGLIEVGLKELSKSSISPVEEKKEKTDQELIQLFLDVPFEIKAIEEDEDGNHVFEGYASTFGNVDWHNDIMVQGCFQKSIQQFNMGLVTIPVLWQHDYRIPLGIYVKMTEDSKGLFVRGIMPKSDTFVSGRVVPQMKVGSVTKMSIGIWVHDYEIKDDVRYINKAELFEISLVTFPANEEARVTSVKSMESKIPVASKDYEWNEEEALERVGHYLNESPIDHKKHYNQLFLCYDKEELAKSKFLICDIVDNELTIVPKALYSASVKLLTSTEQEIPENKVPETIEKLKNLFELIGIESPFSVSQVLKIDDLSMFSERETEKLLRKGVCLTKTNAKKFISALKLLDQRDVEKD